MKLSHLSILAGAGLVAGGVIKPDNERKSLLQTGHAEETSTSSTGSITVFKSELPTVAADAANGGSQYTKVVEANGQPIHVIPDRLRTYGNFTVIDIPDLDDTIPDPDFIRVIPKSHQIGDGEKSEFVPDNNSSVVPDGSQSHRRHTDTEHMTKVIPDNTVTTIFPDKLGDAVPDNTGEVIPNHHRSLAQTHSMIPHTSRVVPNNTVVPDKSRDKRNGTFEFKRTATDNKHSLVKMLQQLDQQYLVGEDLVVQYDLLLVDMYNIIGQASSNLADVYAGLNMLLESLKSMKTIGQYLRYFPPLRLIVNNKDYSEIIVSLEGMIMKERQIIGNLESIINNTNTAIATTKVLKASLHESNEITLRFKQHMLLMTQLQKIPMNF
ncbi:hypothetical protein UCRPC4_g05761 [Phaeomoniella chlamydospora]|uniref:Uncharacterized protein n=1 Tax=Phaeomoniella chlamydospora TaxID=158046 RepID=A0A0G2E227_PHACM|nr:hypothetical protein UCRPC4_g05761 [Phaeomoniella chlamydospora]